MKIKIIAAILILALITIPFGVYKHYNSKGEVVRVEIPQGANAGKIAAILEEQGVIKSPLWFKICTKI